MILASDSAFRLLPGRKWAGEMMLLERERVTDVDRQEAFERGPVVGKPLEQYMAEQGLTEEDLKDGDEDEEEEEDDEEDEDDAADGKVQHTKGMAFAT